jgi:hypothetical protein
MAQAAMSIDYQTTLTPAGVVIEDTAAGVRVTIAPLALWLEVTTLLIKAVGVTSLLAPVGLSFLIAAKAPIIVGLVLTVLATAFWLLTVYRFVRDCWEFQRFTILEADPSGLTWRRTRGRGEKTCRIPRRFIRDINLLSRRTTWWGQHSVFATVRLWGHKPPEVPQDALTVWVAQGDFGTAFDVINRLREALKISASDAAAL